LEVAFLGYLCIYAGNLPFHSLMEAEDLRWKCDIIRVNYSWAFICAWMCPLCSSLLKNPEKYPNQPTMIHSWSLSYLLFGSLVK